MKIFPAIDIIGGRAVRLTQGEYGSEKVYGEDVAALAKVFLAQGADNLHIVDLDGAKNGAATNFEVIKSIAAVQGLTIQVGGGIRSMEGIEAYLDLGVDRVILGTVAVRDPDLLSAAVLRYGERIAVGVDARDGKIALAGWIQQTEIDGIDFCKKLRDDGVRTVIYTDILKDGALAGANLDVYKTLSKITELNIIASGGVSSLPEIEKLADLGIYGAIIGKALYEGLLSLPNALTAAKGGKPE